MCRGACEAMQNRHEIWELRQMQALPLDAKINMTAQRIRGWVDEFGEDGGYISFSGGKDSTVLVDIARNVCEYRRVPLVFVDTGLEYPEIREFMRGYDNVEWLKPKMDFKRVIERYGYPFISKEVSNCVDGARRYQAFLRGETADGVKEGSEVRWKRLHGELWDNEGNYSQFNHERYRFFLDAPFPISSACCDVMKKAPVHEYARKTGRMPITAQMAEESQIRMTQWLQKGCNAFDAKQPISNPMSFWTEQDVLWYIKERELPIASVYGEIVMDYEKMKQYENQMSLADLGIFESRPPLKTTGCKRTGCMFCGYGAHLEKSPNRFERMKQTHPGLYAYIMKPTEDGGLGYQEIIDWINEHGKMRIRY